MQFPPFKPSQKRRIRSIGRAYALASLAVVLPAAHAQFRASLTGTVTDPQGAVVPGATLTLKDDATGKVLTSITNESGVYNFNALPSDPYTLTTTMAGFQTSSIRALAITPEQANNRNITLQLGTTNTTIDVSADTLPSLETSTASISGTITSNDIQRLPSAGRDVFQLARLAPGSFGDGQQGAAGGTNSLPGTQGPGGSSATSGIYATENGPQTLSGGGQYETNSVSIDGISTTSAVWGGTTIITPNEDSVDSVKITTNGYDAEFGRFSGANMQVTTKSGTNDIHGSVYWRVNRPGLNAYQRYNGPGSLVAGTPAQRGLQRNTARYNEFGGSIGGPILKNRLFAFFAYDTIRNNSQTIGNAWYETPAFDAAAPAGYISNKFTTFAGHTPVNATLITETCGTAGLVEGVNCRTIAGQGIDIGSPLRTAKGTQDPTYVSTNSPGVGGGLDSVADIAHYQTSTPSSITQTQYNGRMDADVTQRDHLAFAIYWQPNQQQYINGPARAYNQWNHNQVNEALSLIYNHTFTPTFLNEARANAAGWRWNEVTDNPQAPFGLPTNTVLNPGSTGSSNGLQPFGASGPSHLNQWTFGYKDVATKVIHNHTMKFGAEATQLHYLQDAVYAARPQFTFYNVWNFLNDAPYNESGTFNRFTGVPFSNRYDMREVIWGGFVQDDWKVTSSLTVNIGLRYNYFNALYSKQNNLPHVVFGSGSSLFTGITLVRGGYAWTPDKGNFGPQIGFAYNPEFAKRFVVRGGYGINYNQEEIAISSNSSGNPNDAVTPSFNQSTPLAADPRIQYNIPADSSSLFGYAPNTNTITNYGANGLPTTSGFRLTALPNRLRTQQVHHFSLDVQTDLGHQFVTSLGYQSSLARHLIFHQNLYVYGQRQGYTFNSQTPYIEYFGDGGASSYNALIADIRKNMSHQFSIDASYTWSKSMDDNSGPYSQDPYAYNPTYARGRSDFNVNNSFRIYGVYEPKFYYGGNKVAKIFANGLSLSGIFNLHSGFPWTPTVNYSNIYYAGSGYGNLRPTFYNGRAGKDTSNAAFINASGPSSNFAGGGRAYFNQYSNAQIDSTVSTYPNPVTFYPVPGISRNSFTGPRYSSVDATVVKTFGLPKIAYLGERGGLEFRADAFNLFNQTNLNIANIQNDINQPNFGTIGGALSGRTVQLQARFSF